MADCRTITGVVIGDHGAVLIKKLTNNLSYKGIRSIFQIVINGFLGETKVMTSIRYRESLSDYRHRPEFSINFQTAA